MVLDRQEHRKTGPAQILLRSMATLESPLAAGLPSKLHTVDCLNNGYTVQGGGKMDEERTNDGRGHPVQGLWIFLVWSSHSVESTV